MNAFRSDTHAVSSMPGWPPFFRLANRVGQPAEVAQTAGLNCLFLVTACIALRAVAKLARCTDHETWDQIQSNLQRSPDLLPIDVFRNHYN